MKIQGESTPVLDGLERLSLDGILADAICPECGRNTLFDFGSSCVLHPENGCINEIEAQCEHCGHRWREGFILRVTAHVIPLNQESPRSQWDDDPEPAKDIKKETKRPRDNHWLSFLKR